MDQLKSLQNKPFVLYAEAEVVYNGRAYSTLKRGNYIFINKPDGSFQVHGPSMTPALNYQPAGSKLNINQSSITCNSKKESLTVQIHNINNIMLVDNWSDNKIIITRTEKELQLSLADNIKRYLGFEPTQVVKEHPTEYGPIDVLAIDESGIHHIIEVKRNKISIAACNQVMKYVSTFNNSAIVKPYVAGPSIGCKALKYCSIKSINYILLNWE